MGVMMVRSSLVALVAVSLLAVSEGYSLRVKDGRIISPSPKSNFTGELTASRPHPLGLILSIKLTPVRTSAGVDWALLIAGSAGWGNYRHQADICHVRPEQRGLLQTRLNTASC